MLLWGFGYLITPSVMMFVALSERMKDFWFSDTNFGLRMSNSYDIKPSLLRPLHPSSPKYIFAPLLHSLPTNIEATTPTPETPTYNIQILCNPLAIASLTTACCPTSSVLINGVANTVSSRVNAKATSGAMPTFTRAASWGFIWLCRRSWPMTTLMP